MEKLFHVNEFKIYLENGFLKISAIFRNQNGEIVAQIEKNEWQHKPLSSGDIWDRNYSKNALEIKDGHGKIILQLKLIKNRMQFQGVFLMRKVKV
jgi:hypothetical protein